MIGHADSPTCSVYIDMTLTRSKVKVKVIEHLNFRLLPITVALSPPPLGTFAWSSKLIVDIDSVGLGLQLAGARFSNVLVGKLSQKFKLPGMSIFHEIQMAIFRYCVTLHSDVLACW